MKKALAIAAILTLCTTAANADPNGVLSYNGPMGASGGTFTWTVTASADATVSEFTPGQANTNYGSDHFLYVDKKWNTDSGKYDIPYRKFYMRFSMPGEYYFSGIQGYDPNGNKISNISQAIMKLTYDANLDSNVLLDPTQDGTYGKGYWNSQSKTRLYGLVQSYDTWTENTITWNNSLSNYGNARDGYGKYYLASNSDCNDANANGYPNYLDANHSPVIPTMYLAETGWRIWDPNAPHVDYFGLVKPTGKPSTDPNYWGTTGPNDGNSMVQKTGLGDANLPNFLDLIANDTDHQVTMMFAINFMWPGVYSKEGAPDEASLPTMTITWVPEPATISLLILGFGAVVMRRRRS